MTALDRIGKTGRLSALVWLGFLAFPLADLISAHPSVARAVLAGAGAAVFVGIYLWLVGASRGFVHARGALAPTLALVAIATAMTLGDRVDWDQMFIFAAAAAGLTTPEPRAYAVVAACIVLAAVCPWVDGADAGTAFSYTASTAGIGLLMIIIGSLRSRNAELHAAREELAGLAVARERLRFARDLHDLVGHSLSVIALKAELAGRLLAGDPAAAHVHVGEIEGVARQALAEVREAVSGYRRPTLAGEIAGARLALETADIETAVRLPPVELEPDVEEVLAWAVREGATNVLRHSGARHSRISVTVGANDATVEIVDDGAGNGSAAANGTGNGLNGLAERARQLAGEVQAGLVPEGGFRLLVSIPTDQAGDPGGSSAR